MSLELEPQAWRELEAYLSEQLSKWRTQNDSIGLDPIKTSELRGRIAAFKELLALNKKAPAIDADVGTY